MRCKVRNHQGEILDATYIQSYKCPLSGDNKAHIVITDKYGPLWPCVASKVKPWFDNYGPDYDPRVRFVVGNLQ